MTMLWLNEEFLILTTYACMTKLLAPGVMFILQRARRMKSEIVWHLQTNNY